MPRAWRRISSSRVSPVPKRSVREQSPPIDRAAISTTQGPRLVDAQLGVDGTLAETQGQRGPAGDVGDRPLAVVGQPRGGHVDRLLEERPVERVGLVEQGEHRQRAVDQEPLQRHLAAGDEPLDQHLVRSLQGRDLRRAEDRLDPAERGHESVPIVGPDDAATRRQDGGLQDHRVRDLAAAVSGSSARERRRNGGDADPRAPEGFPHGELVPGGGDRRHRVRLEAERLRHRGADHGAPGRPPGTTALIGCRRANSTTLSADFAGLAKSRVSRLSGSSASRTLGRSRPPRPRRRASWPPPGSRGPVGRGRDEEEQPEHGMPGSREIPATARESRRPAGRLALGGLVVGVVARRVVGHVEDLGDLGDLLEDQPLDARL